MTFNEFKFCCTVFCNNFKGVEYGNVIGECYIEDYTIIVKNVLYYDYTIQDIVIVKLRPKNTYIMRYDSEELIDLKRYRNTTLKTVKDFLIYFNIHVEDIV